MPNTLPPGDRCGSLTPLMLAVVADAVQVLAEKILTRGTGGVLNSYERKNVESETQLQGVRQ